MDRMLLRGECDFSAHSVFDFGALQSGVSGIDFREC
jgi:hypothetical protein